MTNQFHVVRVNTNDVFTISGMWRSYKPTVLDFLQKNIGYRHDIQEYHHQLWFDQTDLTGSRSDFFFYREEHAIIFKLRFG